MRNRQRLLSVASCTILALVTSTANGSAQVVSATTRPPAAITVRYAYTGRYGEGDNKDSQVCRGSRRNGMLVVDGTLVYDGGAPSEPVTYSGKGRVAINIDDCNLKPTDGVDVSPGRGMTEQSEYCNMTIVASHDADISVTVGAGEFVIRWDPVAPVQGASVTGDCMPSMIAAFRADVVKGSYNNEQVVSPYEPSLIAMTAGGIPQFGVYQSASSPSDLGRWTLSLAPGRTDETQIAIEGPACGCINGEDAEGKPLRFTATASAKGGVFQTFTVKSAGKSPRVIVNTGGATPRLDLAGSRGTGATTLAIVYNKDGKRYTTEHSLSWCVVDSVAMADGFNDIAFNESDPGRLDIRLMSKAWLDGAEISSGLQWKLESMGSGTELTPGEATGAAVVLGYTNLPRESKAFGPKTVTVRAKKGSCNCTRERKPRIFFRALATNHPAAESSEQKDAANFFFYWMQTAAAKGVNTPFYEYRKELPNVNEAGGATNVVARFVADVDRIFIADATLTAGCRGPAPAKTRSAGPGTSGIDCFAENLRHEWQHRVDWKAWWPAGYQIALDPDLDSVPYSVESSLPGCSNVSRKSCAARPFDDVTDLEINAYYAGWKWQRGSANTEDWSCGGKQWKGGECRKD